MLKIKAWNILQLYKIDVHIMRVEVLIDCLVRLSNLKCLVVYLPFICKVINFKCKWQNITVVSTKYLIYRLIIKTVTTFA